MRWSLNNNLTVMITLNIIFLFLLILVNMNFVLLNEETLIFICFVTFCWLINSKLANSTTNYFKTQQNLIKSSIFLSFDQNLNNLKTLILYNKKNQKWSFQFFELKKHFSLFSKNLIFLFPNFCQANFQNSVYKKLVFTRRLEQQMLKLISLILIEKLQKIVLIQTFLKTTLQFKPFYVIHKICLREYLNKIY